MTQLFLQPAIESPAPRNIGLSISQAVDLASLTLWPDERRELVKLFPGGKACVWGVPGEGYWKLMERGDAVLFLTGPNGLVKYIGVVAATLESTEVARKIWGDSCSHYRHIYFLTQVRTVDLKRADVNAALGYDSEYNWQGFTIVRKSAVVVSAFLALVGAPSPLPAYVDEGLDLDESDGEDGIRLSTYRKEQSKLKDGLFAGKLSLHCAVCCEYYPRKFLIASHLKKRSECNPKERVKREVVLPMCVFGCDALYEQGYLSLGWESKKVIQTSKSSDLDGTAAGRLLGNLIGKPSVYPLELHKQFLEWHHGNYGADDSTVPDESEPSTDRLA